MAAMQRAGWATIDITPELGVPLGGRGPQFASIDEIIDPLSAQALLLEDDNAHRVLLVSLDLVGIGTAFGLELRHSLATMTGVPYEAIVVNFSHTHSGPMTIVDKYPVIKPAPENLLAYEKQLKERVVSVAIDAANSMRSVDVRSFVGSSSVGINRRRRGNDGEMAMDPNPDGYVNDDLWGLDISVTDGSASDRRCLLFGYGCHAVTVYSWKWQACSADYPGATRRALERLAGEGTHVQFLQGFAGNVRPARLADLDAGRFRPSVADDHEQIGETLATDVSNALGRASGPIELDIRAASGHFQAWRDREAVLPLEHWRSLAESDSELDRNLGEYWADAIEHRRPLAAAVPWDIGLIRFSEDVRAGWMAGEVCAEWLPLIRGWLELPSLHGIGYCHDLPSYLPTSSLIEEGGYEVIRSNWYRKTGPGPYEVGIETSARDEFLRLARLIESEEER